MKLVCLGTGGMVPSGHRGQTACYMLPEQGILLDAGTGLYRMRRYLQTSWLDVYITHEHGDHLLGLHFLAGAVLTSRLNWAEDSVTDEAFVDARNYSIEFGSHVRIHAPSDTMSSIKSNPTYQNLIKHRKWQWLECESQEELQGGGTLTCFPLQHTVPCVGFRLDWPGHSLAYVTDTIADPDGAYIEHITGVDLLLHERALPDRMAATAQEYGHGCTTSVARVAAAARAGRLVCIHSDPSESELEKAQAIFPATEEAFDGMEIEF